jgi:hypothetical protein
MHDLKDKLNNNIEAKKDDIKSFTQNKIEQFATRINNKLKDASKVLMNVFFKRKKANDSKEKEDNLDNTSSRKELTKLDEKLEELSSKEEKLNTKKRILISFSKMISLKKLFLKLERMKLLLGSSLDSYAKKCCFCFTNK